MATIHQAEIHPSKLELITSWLPGQPWAPEDAGALETIGAFRFDDPDGEVGVETHLLRGPGGILQVPLTYRGAPLEGGDAFLVGTMEHSVLGRRWVYDGCGDPVYAGTLAAVALGAAAQAEEEILGAGGTTRRREPSVRVAGTGHTAADLPRPARTAELSISSDAVRTIVVTDGWELAVLRRVEPAHVAGDELALTGTWAGQDLPVRLATARRL